LPAGDLGAIERCSFCGAETRDGPPPEPPRPPEPLPVLVPAPLAAPVLVGTLAIGVVVLLGVVIVLLRSAPKTEATSPTTVSPVPPPLSAPPPSPHPAAPSVTGSRPLTPATLATAPLTQWKTLRSTPLDAPNITGDYRAFDVVGNLDWASSIATAWNLDAKLWRLYVQGVAADGTIDLSPGGAADVILQYNSPKGDLDLSLEVHPPRGMSEDAPGAHVDVSVSPHRDTTSRDRLPKPKCPLARVFSLLRSGSGLGDANRQYGTSVGLVLNGSKAYWNVAYVTGKMTAKGVQDFVNAETCAIEHPR
jgi:hypothetical protein